MPPRKYPSGSDKRNKKRKIEQFVQSHSGALDKFIVKETQNLVENSIENENINDLGQNENENEHVNDLEQNVNMNENENVNENDNENENVYAMNNQICPFS